MFGRKAHIANRYKCTKKEPSEVLTNYLENKYNIDHHRKEKWLQQVEEAISNILASQKKQKETYDRKKASYATCSGYFCVNERFHEKETKRWQIRPEVVGVIQNRKDPSYGVFMCYLYSMIHQR